MKPIITKLAGVTHNDAQANIKKYGGPGIGHYDLIRGPDNPHDHNAIRVALFGQIFMGYVPAKTAAMVAPLMDKPIEQNHIRRVYKRVLVKAGIREMRLHDIRHTFASLLLSQGESPVYVKEQLGHSSIKMTALGPEESSYKVS